MNIENKHLEIKTDKITNEKLIEYYKKKQNDMMFQNRFDNVLENLGYIVGYNIITDQNDAEITMDRFINDLKRKIEEENQYQIDISICSELDEYIDFENSNIDVGMTINIPYELQEFLKK